MIVLAVLYNLLIFGFRREMCAKNGWPLCLGYKLCGSMLVLSQYSDCIMVRHNHQFIVEEWTASTLGHGCRMGMRFTTWDWRLSYAMKFRRRKGFWKCFDWLIYKILSCLRLQANQMEVSALMLANGKLSNVFLFYLFLLTI